MVIWELQGQGEGQRDVSKCMILGICSQNLNNVPCIDDQVQDRLKVCSQIYRETDGWTDREMGCQTKILCADCLILWHISVIYLVFVSFCQV